MHKSTSESGAHRVERGGRRDDSVRRRGEILISSQADRIAAEAAKAKASSDEAAREAEEKAEEAEEAVEREGDGQGVLPTARTIGLGAVEQSDAVHKSNCRGASPATARSHDLHAIDATSARWRGHAGSSPLDGATTVASSPRNDFVKIYRYPRLTG